MSWIDVTKELPEEGKPVYVIGKDKECVHLSILKNGVWTLYKGSEVTHWTPMETRIEYSKQNK
jgi:hypothetical protein